MRRLFIALLISNFVMATASAVDITGLWVGYYETNDGRVECAMVIAAVGDEFAGSMVERQTFGNEFLPGLPADVAGFTQGRQVRLSKHYVHTGNDSTPPLYEMQLSESGDTMQGSWRLPGITGNAWFRRVTGESAGRIPEPR